jgi:hypothetical protein
MRVSLRIRPRGFPIHPRQARFHDFTFTAAHTVQKEGGEYPVFLVVASR